MFENIYSFEVHKQIFNLLKDIFIIIDANYGTILTFNNAALKFYGYSEEELLHKNIYNLFSSHELDYIKLQFSFAFEKDIFIDCIQFDKEKNAFLTNMQVQGIFLNKKKYLILTIRDTKTQKNNLYYIKDSNNLENRKIYDRNVLIRQLDKNLSLAKRIDKQCALLIVEVKIVTDLNTIESNKKESIFISIESKFKKCLRKEDDIFRISENEFAIIQTMVNKPENTVIVAKKIINNLNSVDNIIEKNIYLSASIGISISSETFNTPINLIKNAYNSLYNVKLSGGGFYQIYNLHTNKPNNINTLVELNKRNNLNRNIILNKDAYKAYKSF